MTSVSEADLDYLLLAHVISVSEYFTGHRTAKDYYSISTSAQTVDAMQADINSYICCNTALTDRRSRFRMRTEMRLYDLPFHRFAQASEVIHTYAYMIYIPANLYTYRYVYIGYPYILIYTGK